MAKKEQLFSLAEPSVENPDLLFPETTKAFVDRIYTVLQDSADFCKSLPPETDPNFKDMLVASVGKMDEAINKHAERKGPAGLSPFLATALREKAFYEQLAKGFALRLHLQGADKL